MEINWDKLIKYLVPKIQKIHTMRTTHHKNGNHEKNCVTDAELFLTSKLEAYFSNYHIVCEESNHELHDEYILIDPIDGTRNFIENNSRWAISVCHIKDFQCKGGVVIYPELNITLRYDGKDVYFNDVRIKPASKKQTGRFRISSNISTKNNGLHTGSLAVTMLYLLSQYTNIDVEQKIDYYYGRNTYIWDYGMFPSVLVKFMKCSHNEKDFYKNLIMQETYLFSSDNALNSNTRSSL